MGLPGLTIEHPNLHSGPSLESPVLRVLEPNTELEVFERQGVYWRVRTALDHGFVHEALVVPNPGGELPPEPPEPKPVISGALPGFLAADASLSTIDLAPDALLSGGSGVATTWNVCGGLLNSLAQSLGFDVALAVGVLAVESGGRSLGETGRMLIRFENHIFFDQWGKTNPELFHQHFGFNPPPRTWEGHQWRPTSGESFRACHANQAVEWEVLEFARSLDDAAALMSISMGLTQVMGFNFATVGYPTVRAMFDAFNSDPRYQVLAFFDYVQRRVGVEALQQRDFATIARRYNGDGQVDTYVSLMSGAVAQFQSLHM
ncbi:MAG TPA: N-acetylmuramidase domain-containing protein [Dehalococcoidia bacterium]|nr:N-acetylmuramidase domain-containing protein [Dehalococcoidia bacterium]